MPYAVRTRDNRYCVVKLAEGNSPQRTLKCYDTRREAERYKTALDIATADEK